MSLFVDFLGLNSLISSSFSIDPFDNIIESRRGSTFTQATATLVYDGSTLPSAGETITFDDGKIGGGIGSFTFTFTSGAPSSDNETQIGGTTDAMGINLKNAILGAAGLKISAEIDAGTNTITLTLEQAGERGNGLTITTDTVGVFTTIESFSGGKGLTIDEEVNGINIHRNGPYGFPTFKQIRIHENPLTRYQRRNNILSFTKRGEQTEFALGEGNIIKLQEKFGDKLTFTEPAVVSSYHPLEYNLGIFKGENVPFIERFGLSFDYGNHITHFSNQELNNLLLLEDLEDEVYDEIKSLYLDGALESNSSEINYFEFLRYKQDIFPKEINKYGGAIRSRKHYLNDFWRDIREERSQQARATGFGYTAYQSMWNMDADVTWLERQLTSDIIGRDNVSGSGILQNQYCHFTENTGGPRQSAGLRPAPIYNRRHSVPGSGSYVADHGMIIPELASATNFIPLFQGDALWEAGVQSGKNPFYSSYDHFAEQLRGLGKDYTIVPEFRVSEHMETYESSGSLFFLDNIFELTGAISGAVSDSSESTFYETYSTSDFLKHFAKIKDDHKDFVNPGTLTLTCKALKKFLAYDSFYPQQRTVDMAKQFNDSYRDFINIQAGTLANPQIGSIGIQPILDPLFAPGVLFNSIKAGVACDYPIFVTEPSVATLSSSNGADFAEFFGLEGNFQQRVPFEALVEPERYLAKRKVFSGTAHSSGNLSASAIWDGKAKNNLYTKMMSNFLAEVPDFFLRDSSFTTIASLPQGDDNFGKAEFGKTYSMRIKMFRSMDRENRLTINGTNAYMAPQARRGRNRETLTMYSRPSAFGPPVVGCPSTDTHVSYDSRDGFNPCFTPPYYDGEAWIDVAWTAPQPGTAGAGAGLESRKFTLSEILLNLTASAIRFDIDTMNADNEFTASLGPLAVNSSISMDAANISTNLTFQGSKSLRLNPEARIALNHNSMQLFASINALETGRIITKNIGDDIVQPTFVATNPQEGSPDSRWIIQTKFESPILNFQNVSLTIGSNRMIAAYQGATPRGMWHQYGVKPTSDEGIFMQVTDIPRSWTDSTFSDPKSHLTGSLADLCGFSTEPVKLGVVANKKTISEAVVAVPFIIKSGVKKFFDISEENFNNAQKYFQALSIVNGGGDPQALGLGNPDFWEARAGKSIIDQVTKMKKYVFPPTMDFITFPDDVKPFAMYIFEFEHSLTEQDLSDIWQGLPPDIGVNFETAESTVSHKILANELLGAGDGDDKTQIGDSLETEIRWMVFKVKKRAKTDYFSKIAGKNAGFGTAALAAGFTTNAQSAPGQAENVSYNWPYDFFSLVELVKIDAEVEFADIPEGKFEPKQSSVPEAVRTFAANLSNRRR